MGSKISRQTELSMTEGPIGKMLFIYTMPILTSQILQQFYSVADAALIGQYVGVNALAAVGISSLLLSVIINFFIGISTGISVLTSQLFGAKEYDKLRDNISTSILLCIVAGIVMTVAGLVGTDYFLAWLQTPGEIYPLAQIFLHICFWGMVPQLLFNIGAAILRSLGNTRSSLWYLVLSSTTNLILNFWLVAGWNMGITGAALATVLSQWLSALLVVSKLFRLDKRYALSISLMRLQQDVYKELLSKGLPSGMQAIFMSISSLVIQTSINSFGTVAVAGMILYARIEGFLYYPLFSFGMAVTGFVGQNMGAHKEDRIHRGMFLAMITSVLFSIGMSILLIFCSEPVLKVFTSNQAVIESGRQAILYIFPFYFLYGINQVYIGAIRGLGDTSYPMITSLLFYCIFRVTFCTGVLPLWHDMRVIYAAYDISWMLIVILLYFRFEKLSHKLLNDIIITT
ncbi:MATE efflux family protein [Alkaliphilus metalliredigens QYMF]|uniref:Probable multidrug resistance protein NorM n=1 Tax=Alkaliphilus metalliredigens (strain QYMF) TaxID=293826 RepID=A6TUW5_ALKMQ|nr:MATE family efflux transporter [Alkaliphilus metalliredigens]ABR49983.1 MATE efflux family protein [Alkaliphilus metalliredigens QYMF]